MINISNFIDSIIRDHKKHNKYGYELTSNQLSQDVIKEVINFLYQNDEAFKEKINDYIDGEIESRIDMVYAEDMYEGGCVPVRDKTNDEITWRFVG